MLFTLVIKAQSGDSLALKIADKEAATRVFQQALFQNPANYLNFRTYSLTEFYFEQNSTNNEAHLVQYGQGQHSFTVGANAYHKQDTNKAMWGKAMYKQGKRENVQWNESADYDTVFPYVVADSVGGTIQYEHYRFEGGYTQRLDSYTIGISGYYQAQMEYRKVDPRPKNITAFFGFEIGGTKTFNNKIVLGLNAGMEKYTQKHRMSFYNPIGFPTIYQLSGMGNYNSLLKGKRKEAYYEGWTYQVNLQLYEAQKRNWFLTADIKHFAFEKLLPEFYDLQASTAKDTEYNLTIGKLFDYNQMTFGIRGDGFIKERLGTENVFINQSTTNYLKIAEFERYKYQEKTARFSGLWKYDKAIDTYSATPFIAVSQVIESYSTPFSKTAINYCTYGIHGQWLHTFKNNAIFTTNASWTATDITNEQARFNFGESNAINQMLIDNYRFQTTANWTAALQLRYHFPIPKISNAFLGFNYTYQQYRSDHNSGFEATMGITF